MKKIAITIVLVLFGTVSAMAQDGGQITVSGVGSVATVPDMATIRLGVRTEDRIAAVALSANSQAVAEVLDGSE